MVVVVVIVIVIVVVIVVTVIAVAVTVIAVAVAVTVVVVALLLREAPIVQQGRRLLPGLSQLLSGGRLPDRPGRGVEGQRVDGRRRSGRIPRQPRDKARPELSQRDNRDREQRRGRERPDGVSYPSPSRPLTSVVGQHDEPPEEWNAWNN